MAEEAGQPLDAAIVIGVDPLTLLASQAIVPIDHDELEIAGALQGRPLPVVKCLTSDIRVPAEAEIVIEGRFLPGVREPEGPFGEFPQYYGDARQPRGDGGRRGHPSQGRDLPHHGRRRAGASAARRDPEGSDAAHASAAQFPERARRASVAGRRHALPSLRQDQEDPGRAGQERHPRRVRRLVRSQACHRGRRGRRHPQSDRGRVGDRDALPGRPRSRHRAGEPGLQARSVQPRRRRRQDGPRRHQAARPRRR